MNIGLSSRRVWRAVPFVLALLAMGVPATGTEAADRTAVAVSAGGYHTCAVLSDGTAWCWGANNYGQLGDGTTDPSAVPVQVRQRASFLTHVRSISASFFQTCAVKTDDSVWCWGWNLDGRLGDGTTISRYSAVRVRQGAGFLTHVRTVQTGDEHGCALKTDGTVWCWGHNAHGALGDGTTSDRLTAVQVQRPSGPLTGVRSIGIGLYHSCAAKTDGTAWCWGDNDQGQLGDGTTTQRSSAVRVKMGSGHLTHVASVTAGSDHSCARQTHGTIWCWGRNDHGQLGDGTHNDRATAVQVRQGRGFFTAAKSVAAGGSDTCGLTSDGGVWCWGWNDSGRLGDGTTTERPTPVRVRMSLGFLAGVESISTGKNAHSCVITTNGTGCWGSDTVGQLGDGTTGDADGVRLLPVRVLLPT